MSAHELTLKNIRGIDLLQLVEAFGLIRVSHAFGTTVGKLRELCSLPEGPVDDRLPL